MREDRANLFPVHFARMMVGRTAMAGSQARRFKEIIEELINDMNEGHSCLELEKDDIGIVKKSGLVSSGELTPLIIADNRLYLHRYYSYEYRLARQIIHLAGQQGSTADVSSILNMIFCEPPGKADLQRQAAELAATKSLAIISGGPGTGKTTTVVRILELLLRVKQGSCRIVLAAPTGKAAMRLHQSLKHSFSSSQFAAKYKSSNILPEKATTLHRLLGVRRGSAQFIHNSENRLDADVVIVDEASMIDLALMSKLVDAMRPDAKLILLGDKDQLASVESGSVLADMIESLPQNTVVLKKTYRFNAGIKRLSRAVNNNNQDRAWRILAGDEFENVRLLGRGLRQQILSGYDLYGQSVLKSRPGEYQDIFMKFSSFQVLCGTRSGPKGVGSLNQIIENDFKEKCGYSGQWYPGRPVLITRNSYDLGLYNGDIGICLSDDQGTGDLKVFFEGEDGGLKSYLPYRLPEHQTAFAMTIHKSQGSEFEQVVVVLPDDDSPVLTRELVYTAITRAKKRLWIHCDRTNLSVALARKTHRKSGLGVMLKKHMGAGVSSSIDP